MAPTFDLPCDGEGHCMKCKSKPTESESLLCRTCATPWHVPCLSSPPENMAAAVDWLCPDCSPVENGDASAAAVGSSSGGGGDLIAAIKAIEADGSLTEKEKAKRRQALVSGKQEDQEEEGNNNNKRGDVLDTFDQIFSCSICMQLAERPVTTPCGHNFCLKCFQKWVGQGKQNCANCRAHIPRSVASQPRINSTLVVAIRLAKSTKSATAGQGHVYHFVRNENRPDKAFTTERAKKAGKANACSGQIFVTVPPDHFGPIPAENDPKMNRGVLVGDSWDDRLECRQWGAHLPHVAGIAGQSGYGSQSVALSGGYQDDEDHGEWFLYTGSGGRDLSGNKRTNKDQSSDQKFEKLNQALKVSCMMGYPVRVVRSFKEKRSSYAPEKGVRYDGAYRIEKCWRKTGIQGFKVCRYLFVRCDNEPAPWTSDLHGDRPRPLPTIKELRDATDVTERKNSPSWDFDEEKGWMWMKPPPASKKPVRTGDPNERNEARKAVRRAKNTSVRDQLLKGFSCLICRDVMTSPLSTPCGHNFCKLCLLGAYADQSFVRDRGGAASGRTLRAKKIVKKCPSCPTDISDFLQNPLINTSLMSVIDHLKEEAEKEKDAVAAEGGDEDGETNEVVDEDGSGDADSRKSGEEGSGEVDADPNDLEEERNIPPLKRKRASTEKESAKKAKLAVAAAAADDSPLSPLGVSAQEDDYE